MHMFMQALSTHAVDIPLTTTPDSVKTQLEIRWYTPVVSGSIAVAWFSAGAAFVTGLMKLLSVWGK